MHFNNSCKILNKQNMKIWHLKSGIVKQMVRGHFAKEVSVRWNWLKLLEDVYLFLKVRKMSIFPIDKKISWFLKYYVFALHLNDESKKRMHFALKWIKYLNLK